MAERLPRCLYCRTDGPTKRVRIILAGVRKRTAWAYLCRSCREV